MQAVNTQSSKLEQMLSDTVEAMGFAIWGIDYMQRANRARLCVFIESNDGITVDDCASVSDQIQAILDVERALPSNLTIEVSSPGLDRVLFKPEQFEAYVGEVIDVRLSWPKLGRSHVRGRLRSSDEQSFCIDFDDGEFTVDFEQLRRARVVPSLN